MSRCRSAFNPTVGTQSMFKYSHHVVALVIACFACGGICAQEIPSTPEQKAALEATAPRHASLAPVFEDFGGKPGLVALMDDFMDNMMADPRMRPFFAEVDRERVKAKLVEQFCVILDGPCEYTGDANTVVHEGLAIDRADFNALVENLQRAMDKHEIPFRAQNKLLAVLAPMHTDIITE